MLLMDLLGLLCEGGSIAVPAYLLYGVHPGRGDHGRVPGTEVLLLGARATWPLILVTLLVAAAYALWCQLWLRRVRLRARARALSPIEELYVIASRLPRESLVLRPLLWLVAGVAYVGWLTARGLPTGSQLPLLWLFSLNPLLTGALHSLAYDRLLWGGAWSPLGERAGELRRFAGRYSVELARATLLSTALAVLFTLAFTLSVPFNLEQFQRAQRYLPGLLLLLLYAGYRYSSAAILPIKRYLAAVLGPSGAGKEIAAAAYQAAQSLPYRLGAAMVVSSLLAAVVLLGLLRPLLDLPGESLLLILGVALSVTTAASLYAIIWHRFTLRTFLGHLRAQHAFQPSEVPAPLSLMRKMVYGFGLPIMCACLLSLLWSFVQYKTLANHHVQRLARDRLETLREDLAAERAAGQGGEGADALAGQLARIVAKSGLGLECFVYFLPAGASEAVELGGAAREGRRDLAPPRLPPYPVAHLRARQAGELDLPQLELTGAYERLVLGERVLGTVAVLYPNYRHPGLRGGGEGQRGQDPLRGQLLGLIAFFVVLMAVSGGVVVMAAVDLSRPLRYLERRAAAMAQGDLTSPVVTTAVEVDEAGGLTFAFEEMRRALSEMLRSSTEMNLQLEEEVARRTQELSRRNQEVIEAMSRLQLARGELVRAEKLATMGRIAASVTSEINNPVNAMTTMPEPLTEELDELERLSREAPLRRDRIATSLSELRKMTEVLQRSAHRAKEIVHATRIHARLGDDKVGAFELGQVVEEVLQLFGELPRFGVRVRREMGVQLPIMAVRSHLGQLLSGWLARRAPRLREGRPSPDSAEPVELLVRTRRVPGEGGDLAELLLSDTGPPLGEAELRLVRDELSQPGAGPAEPPLDLAVGSGASDDEGARAGAADAGPRERGPAGGGREGPAAPAPPRTWLRLRLPLPPPQ